MTRMRDFAAGRGDGKSSLKASVFAALVVAALLAWVMEASVSRASEGQAGASEVERAGEHKDSAPESAAKGTPRQLVVSRAKLVEYTIQLALRSDNEVEQARALGIAAAKPGQHRYDVPLGVVPKLRGLGIPFRIVGSVWEFVAVPADQQQAKPLASKRQSKSMQLGAVAKDAGNVTLATEGVLARRAADRAPAEDAGEITIAPEAVTARKLAGPESARDAGKIIVATEGVVSPMPGVARKQPFSEGTGKVRIGTENVLSSRLAPAGKRKSESGSLSAEERPGSGAEAPKSPRKAPRRQTEGQPESPGIDPGEGPSAAAPPSPPDTGTISLDIRQLIRRGMAILKRRIQQ